MRLSVPEEFVSLAEKTAEKHGCAYCGVSFKLEKKRYVLRLTIEGEKASLDTCAVISRELSKWLDKNESKLKCPSYDFEVSTPGPDKPIKTKEDFLKRINKLVYIETKTKAADGRKRYKGRVKSVSDDKVRLYIEEESAEFDIVMADIAKARMEYEF